MIWRNTKAHPATVLSVLALSVGLSHAGDKIQFSAPQKPSNSASDPLRHRLEKDLRKGGSREAMDPIAVIQSGNLSSNPSSSKADEKRLRKLLDQKNNWIFMDPESFGETEGAESLFGEDSEESEFSFETEDTSLIGKFLANDSSKKAKNNKSQDDEDEDDFSSEDLFGNFSSESPIFEALETALGSETGSSIGTALGLDDSKPKEGWAILFGSKLDSDSDSKPNIFDPNRIELDRMDKAFADKMFSGTSFLGDIGTNQRFDADKEFDSLMNPGLGKMQGLTGNSLINQATDPGREALNPIVGRSATESIQFSGGMSDFTSRSSQFNPTIGSELLRSELPMSGGSSIMSPAASEPRRVDSVPNLPTVFEIPRTRGF